MFGLEAVWRDGKVVGHIRRADFGFAIDKTIAYGYIRDPAGGPVSADPRDGCASLPAATNTHCCHCGGTAAPSCSPRAGCRGRDVTAPWQSWCHPLSLCEVPARLKCCLGC